MFLLCSTVIVFERLHEMMIAKVNEDAMYVVATNRLALHFKENADINKKIILVRLCARNVNIDSVWYKSSTIYSIFK